MLDGDERTNLLSLLQTGRAVRLVFQDVCLPANRNGGIAPRLPGAPGDRTIILLHTSGISNAGELVAGRHIAGKMKHVPLIAILGIIATLLIWSVSTTGAVLCGILASFLLSVMAHTWWNAYAERVSEKRVIAWTAICMPDVESDLPRLLYPYLQEGWETVNQRDRPDTPFIVEWSPDDIHASLGTALAGASNADDYDYDYARRPHTSSGAKTG